MIVGNLFVCERCCDTKLVPCWCRECQFGLGRACIYFGKRRCPNCAPKKLETEP